MAAPVDKNDAVNLITLQQAISDQQKAFQEQQEAFEVKTLELYSTLKTEVEKILAKTKRNPRKKNEESSGRRAS